MNTKSIDDYIQTVNFQKSCYLQGLCTLTEYMGALAKTDASMIRSIMDEEGYDTMQAISFLGDIKISEGLSMQPLTQGGYVL